MGRISVAKDLRPGVELVGQGNYKFQKIKKRRCNLRLASTEPQPSKTLDYAQVGRIAGCPIISTEMPSLRDGSGHGEELQILRHIKA